MKNKKYSSLNENENSQQLRNSKFSKQMRRLDVDIVNKF